MLSRFYPNENWYTLLVEATYNVVNPWKDPCLNVHSCLKRMFTVESNETVRILRKGSNKTRPD